MPFVLENFTQYNVSSDEAASLVRMGLIVQTEDWERPGCYLPDHYELTAFVWEDLGLQGREDVAWELFDRVLGRKVEPS